MQYMGSRIRRAAIRTFGVSLLVGTAVLPLLSFAQTTDALSLCPQLSANLQYGATDVNTNGQVSQLQAFLSNRYLASSTKTVTGYFGELTKNSLLKFQKALDLPLTGMVDFLTRQHIIETCGIATSSIEAVVPTASFGNASFTSLFAAPTIRGTASNVSMLRVVIHSLNGGGAGPAVYENDQVPVTAGSWSTNVFLPLENGGYELELFSRDTLLATSTMQIGLVRMPLILSDTSLPSSDVSDGRLMRFQIVAPDSGSVSIGKLSFTIATTAADISDLDLYAYTDIGFTDPVPALTDGLVNDSGPLQPDGTMLTITPSSPLIVPAGQSYFFELDATVIPSDASYSVRTTLLGDRPTSTMGSFADLAGGSNFVWSPNTYDEASTTETDWTTGFLTSGLSMKGVSQLRTSPPIQTPPTCSMTADPSTVSVNQPFTITWTSTDATSSLWSTGTRDLPSGSRAVSGATSTTAYLMTFYGPYGTAVCSAAVTVGQSTSQSGSGTATSTGSTNNATSTATTTRDSFTATPLSGKPTLAVTFKGTVNTSSSCAKSTYTFGYGDNTSSSTITVSANLCKPQAFTLNHGYTKTGTFNAMLWKNPSGTATTSQLIQSQPIRVSLTASSQQGSNLASVISATFGEEIARLLKGFLRL